MSSNLLNKVINDQVGIQAPRPYLLGVKVYL